MRAAPVQQRTVPVLEVRHLSKRFCRELRRSLRYAVSDLAQELRPRRGAAVAPPRPGEFAALDDVSFDLRPGEALGVVGSNGAGKSTLLKVLYGLIKPDGGEVRIRGRVAALIELGTGFEPVLTGRENIALNGAILGLPPDRLALLTDEIIAFAELEDAIDSPVRYYSSGMSARLAFAIAAHLEPDLLIVDEVLGVGDAAFQRKCAVYMRRFLDRGGALIFVSHNPYQVQALCDRGLVLENGRPVFLGTAVDAVSRHLAGQQAGSSADEDGMTRTVDRAAPVVISDVEVVNPDGGPLRNGAPMRVSVDYRSLDAVEVMWGFTVWTGDQWICVTGAYDTRSAELRATAGRLSCLVPRLPLVPGRYTLRLVVAEARTHQPLAQIGHDDAPIVLEVEATGSIVENAQVAMNQMVTLDVDWD